MREPDPQAVPRGSASTDPSTDHRDPDRRREVREETPRCAVPPLARRRWLIPTDPPPV
jgi:hypothetical protein